MKNWKDTSQDFKDSAFGKIPRSWFVKTLLETVGNDKSSIVAGPFGSNLKVSDYRNEGVPIIRLQNIERNQFVVKDIQFISPKKAEELAYHSFQGGDIVLAKLGDPVGKTCIVPDQFQHGIVVSDVVRIRVDESRVNKSFLTFLLNSDTVVKQLNSDIIGTTRPRLNLDQIRNILLPLPPKDDQDKIAAILEIIDLSIEQTEQIITKYQRIKTGLMQDLLTRGIDEQGTIRSEETHEFKDSPLGRIPKEWKVGEVGKSCEIHNHLRKPISAQEREHIKGIYPYYGPTGILDYINEYKIDGEYVLIGEDGDHFLKFAKQPMTIRVSGKFNVNNHAHILKGTDKCLTAWIHCFFCHRDIMLHLTRQGAGRLKLNKASLQQLKIVLPSLAEQNSIIRILDAYEKGLTSEKRQLHKLQKIKTGLMQDLLTGKVRVNYKDCV